MSKKLRLSLQSTIIKNYIILQNFINPELFEFTNHLTLSQFDTSHFDTLLSISKSDVRVDAPLHVIVIYFFYEIETSITFRFINCLNSEKKHLGSPISVYCTNMPHQSQFDKDKFYLDRNIIPFC